MSGQQIHFIGFQPVGVDEQEIGSQQSVLFKSLDGTLAGEYLLVMFNRISSRTHVGDDSHLVLSGQLRHLQTELIRNHALGAQPKTRLESSRLPNRQGS